MGVWVGDLLVGRRWQGMHVSDWVGGWPTVWMAGSAGWVDAWVGECEAACLGWVAGWVVGRVGCGAVV